MSLQRPVVGITPTDNRDGYWLVASDGGVFPFADAGLWLDSRDGDRSFECPRCGEGTRRTDRRDGSLP
jgi:hypothetical protein